LPSIPKKDRIAIRQLQKKINASAEDFQKRPAPPPPPKSPAHDCSSNSPTDVLCRAGFFKKKSGQGTENFKKSSDRLLMIVKNDRVATWQLQKKIDAGAEHSKKSSIALLKIPENHRIGC